MRTDRAEEQTSSEGPAVASSEFSKADGAVSLTMDAR